MPARQVERLVRRCSPPSSLCSRSAASKAYFGFPKKSMMMNRSPTQFVFLFERCFIVCGEVELFEVVLVHVEQLAVQWLSLGTPQGNVGLGHSVQRVLARKKPHKNLGHVLRGAKVHVTLEAWAVGRKA